MSASQKLWAFSKHLLMLSTQLPFTLMDAEVGLLARRVLLNLWGALHGLRVKQQWENKTHHTAHYKTILMAIIYPSLSSNPCLSVCGELGIAERVKECLFFASLWFGWSLNSKSKTFSEDDGKCDFRNREVLRSLAGRVAGSKSNTYLSGSGDAGTMM